jgi:hypothetical protein
MALSPKQASAHCPFRGQAVAAGPVLGPGKQYHTEIARATSCLPGWRRREATVNCPNRDSTRQRLPLRLPAVAFEPLATRDNGAVADAAGLVWWFMLLVTALAIVAPLLVTKLPPLLDYPNHLARMELLAHGASDPILSRMYATDWHILPNIAIDAIAPSMLRIVPLEVAGRCVIALALLLPFLGSVSLHISLFHRRSYWPLAAALVVYNQALFLGFLNFLVGLGLALLGAALWARTLRRPRMRLTTALALGLVIFFCHLVALACYGLLVLAVEVAAATEARPGRRLITPPPPARLFELALPFIIPAYLYLHAPLANARIAPYWAPLAKVEGVFAGFATYSFVLDGAAVVLVIGIIAWCWRTGKLLVSRALLVAVLALCIVYPLAPFAAKGTGFLDQRLPPLASFLLFAGTLPFGLPKRLGAMLSFGIIALVSIRLLDIGLVWYHHGDDVAAFRRVIAPIEPGTRVLAVMVTADDVPDFSDGQPASRLLKFSYPGVGRAAIMHLPALVVSERRAFWPLLFSAPTKQPLKVLAPYSSLAVGEGIVPSYTWLSSVSGRALPRDAPYLANWRSKFDFVIVLYAGKLPDAAHLLPNLLTPLVITDVAASYRVKRVAPQP